MVNEETSLFFQYDAEQDWKRVFDEPLNGIGTLKLPGFKSALHLDGIIRPRPNPLTDAFSESAIEIQPGVLRARDGD